MWQRPDSALALLLPYFDTCCTTEYNHHYANLLLAELLYKNDSAQTNRAELQQAGAYFDSLVWLAPPLQRGPGGLKTTSPTANLVFLAARAHYINGVGYYERDSIVEACEEYILALEIMEEHFDEKELVGKKARFMALTYTHLTSKRVAVLLSLSVENEQDVILCAAARALLYMPPCYVEIGRSVCLPSWVICIYYGAFIAFLTAENQVVA